MKLPNQPLTLLPLPYDYDALEPILSAKAMKVHYEGHHAGYVKKYNELLSNKNASSEDLVFNYSGHVLHTHLWNNLGPPNSSSPGPVLLERSKNFDLLKKELIDHAMTIKGVGWTLLLENRLGGLEIKNIPDHELRLVVNHYKPILVLDIWEHAHYLSFLNNRKEYIINLLNCINWDTVEKRLLT